MEAHDGQRRRGPDDLLSLRMQIVTDNLTGVPAGALTSRKVRHRFQVRIRKEVDKTTDVKVKGIVFTDLVVQ